MAIIAPANPRTLSGSTAKAASPTTSGIHARSVAKIGVPVAIASIKIKPNPSQIEAEERRLKNARAQKNAEKRRKLSEQNGTNELRKLKFTNAAEEKNYYTKLAKKYPDGVTSEKYTLGNKKITRKIVVKRGLAKEYRETKTPYGVFYTKNGGNISKVLFVRETLQ